MNTYQAPANPADIVVPSDGSATKHDLNPVSGVQRATATPADAPVMYQGIQLSAAQAAEMGITNESNPNLTTPNPTTKDEATETDPSSDNPDNESDIDTSGADEPMDSETLGIIDTLVSQRGDIALTAISNVLEQGSVTEETLQDLTNATGLDENQAQQVMEVVQLQLDYHTEGASSLLGIAAETNPLEVKSAIVSALSGSYEDAKRLVHQTSQNLDRSSLGANLVEALNADGYETEHRNGRLYVRGHEFPVFEPWSRAYRQFDLSVI